MQLKKNVWAALILSGLMPGAVLAQDRLKTMPGYDQYEKMRSQLGGGGRGGGGRGGGGLVRGGTLTVTWLEGGKAFDYSKDGKRWHYDIATGKTTEGTVAAADETNAPAPGGGRRAGRISSGGSGPPPDRGRQYTSAISPDKKLKAYYQDRNLWLSDADGGNKRQVTTEGDEKKRIKYGTASWVYGEELGQTTAMWWSPDSQKVAYYRFDESEVKDFYLAYDQGKIQTTLNVEPYTKVGTPNPTVDIYIYDVTTRETVKADVRDGKPFDNAVVGHYVYGITWSKDGKELLFHRSNRRQNTMELCACDPSTGKCRVVVHEEWLPSWTDDSPVMRFLEDGKRFIWVSERNGWKNFYLYNLDGKLLTTLTHHDSFEVADIERVDEKAGMLYYLAHDGDNPLKLQLHRVGLDGKGDVRLTDPAYLHSVQIAPDGKHFIDTIQTHDQPPATRLVDVDSQKVLAELAKSDTARFDELGLKKVELLKFKAADGVTDLYGILSFPSQFDPAKKYPVLVSVYGGPDTTGAAERFATPNALTEYGFLVATFDSRSASGRGKKFKDPIYLKLGQTEMDDQAEGVKSLYSRSYVAKDRVGIFGTSYGGTSAATCLLRFPDVFRAASSSSPVTDYRNYDTIYAERYMWIPQENKEGFDAAAVMTYANNLKGRLLLYFGTADNNVHPNNSLQLIAALQRAGKSFEVQVGTDQGHSAVNQDRMMEFFIENLVMAK
jgi:dipeptidyl-peptidase 4